MHLSTDISIEIPVDISTNVLVDMSGECRLICRLTYQWVSVDMSTEMCRPTYQPMYQPRYRPSDDRHIDRLSADISVNIAADTRPIRWPLIVGGKSVDRRWYIGQKLRLLVYKLYAFHPFFGQPQKFLKASCSAFMCRKFSCYQARHSIEILPNTQNTVDRIEDKDDEG